jgi:hypothetical protein
VFDRNNSILISAAIRRAPIKTQPKLHSIRLNTDGIDDNILSAYMGSLNDKFTPDYDMNSTGIGYINYKGDVTKLLDINTPVYIHLNNLY